MKKFLLHPKLLTITLVMINLFLATTVFAKTTTWLPTIGGLWTTAGNWDNGLPVAGDDVIINSNQSAAITAVPTITLASLTISGNCNLVPSASGNTLTVTGTFSVSAGITLSMGTNGTFRFNITLSSTCIGSILGTVNIYSTGTTALFTNSGDLTLGSAALIANGTNASNFTLSSTGILRIASAAGITTSGATGPIQVTGTRTYTSGADYEYNGTAAQVVGNGLTQNTSGNVTVNNITGVSLSATTTISGLLSMTSGTLNMADFTLSVGSLTGSGDMTNLAGVTARTITIGSDNTSPAAYSGVISNGTAVVSITKTGSGKLTLSGLNTYTGTTTISTGTLSVNTISSISGGASSLGAPTIIANGTIVIGGSGILQYTGSGNTSDRIINVSSNGGTIDASGTGTLTLTGGVSIGLSDLVLTGTGIAIESGVIATGSSNLTKNGAGTWTLSGANTYTQTTTISMGTLKLGATGGATNTPLGTTGGSTSVTSGAVLDLNGFTLGTAEALTLNGTGISNGGALTNSSATAAGYSGLITKGSACSIVTNAGNISITNAGSMNGSFLLTLGGSGNGSISSNISGSNGVTKIGAGIWTLSGSSSYTGATTLSEGTLKAGVINQAFGNGSNVILANTTGVVLDITGFNNIIGSLAGGGINGGDVILGAATLTAGNTTSTSYAGVISGTGNISKAGSGTWTLSGLNTYAGKTTISAGTLSINSIDNVGAANSSLGNPSTVANGTIDISGTGIFTYTGSGHFSDRVINLTGDGASINASGSGGLTLSGGITGATFNLVLTGTGGGLMSGIIATTNGTVTKSGTGTWTLSGANTYTGTTNINVGILKYGNNGGAASGPMGNITAGTVVANGATLDLGGFNQSTNEPLTLNGTGISGGGALTNSSVSESSYDGLITLGSTSSIIANAGNLNVTSAGTITGNTFGLTLGGSGNGSIASIIGTTSGTVTKTGTGVWTVSGASTYTGLTTISAGTLKLGAVGTATNTPLGTITNGTVVTSGALDMNGFTLGTTEGLTINGTGILGGGALTNSSATAVSYSGIITLGSSSSIVANAGNISTTGTVSGGTNSLTTGGINTLSLGGSATVTLGDLTIAAGTLTATSGTMNVAGNFTNNSTFTHNSGTVNLNGTTQSISGSSGTTFKNLTISGSGTKTLVTATTIDNGGILNLTAGTFATGTNLSMLSTSAITRSAGNMTGLLQGAGAYNVTYTASSKTTGDELSGAGLNNVTLNLTAGQNLTLDQNRSIPGILTLTNNGYLIVPTGFTLTIENDNAIAGGSFGSAKHIATQVNIGTGAKGFLRINNIPASSAYLLPVGNGTNYLPVTLTPTDATTANNTYSVCVFPGITTNGEPNGTAFSAAQKNNSVDAVWTVNYNGPGSPSAVATDMMVGWPASLEGVNFSGLADNNIGIAHWDNPDWGTVSGAGDNTGNTATRTGITNFSPFGVGRIDYGILAIKISYFNASKGNSYNTLNWQAACSSSQAIFEIERSTNGINFTTISSITASQARCAQPFSYNDNTAPSGTVFYRIKIIDVDGKVSNSAIVKLSSQAKDIELVGVSPNPAANVAQLKINTIKNDVVELAIVSVDGKVVYRNSVQLQSGSSVINIDIANLPGGMYLIKGLFSDGQTNTIKFIKK